MDGDPGLLNGSSTGLGGVWLAYNALMISRFVLLWVRFRGSRWQTIELGHSP
jgi:Na+-driven multidrug efflux pump